MIWGLGFKMADVLNDAPQGFQNAANIISGFPSDVLAEMCQEVLLLLQYKKSSVNIEALLSHCELAGTSSRQKDLQTAVNALIYTFRTAARGRLSAEDLEQQLNSTSLWTSTIVRTIVDSWRQQGGQLINSVAVGQLLSIGHLVDLQWKLGMATSSNQCRNLSSLFVTMVLKVADPSGQVTTKSFEMTVPEFQNFSQQFKDMATVLETV